MSFLSVVGVGKSLWLLCSDSLQESQNQTTAQMRYAQVLVPGSEIADGDEAAGSP